MLQLLDQPGGQDPSKVHMINVKDPEISNKKYKKTHAVASQHIIFLTSLTFSSYL